MSRIDLTIYTNQDLGFRVWGSGPSFESHFPCRSASRFRPKNSGFGGIITLSFATFLGLFFGTSDPAYKTDW